MQEHTYRDALKHFNEPILIGFDLCRCVGYAEDWEDCYLIISNPHRGLAYCTMVGGYIYLDGLKGQNHVKPSSGEEWDDYTRLDDLLELNGAPKVDKFICEVVPAAGVEPALDGS